MNELSNIKEGEGQHHSNISLGEQIQVHFSKIKCAACDQYILPYSYVILYPTMVLINSLSFLLLQLKSDSKFIQGRSVHAHALVPLQSHSMQYIIIPFS